MGVAMVGSERERVSVLVVSGPNAGQEVRFAGDSIELGRAADNDIVLQDDTASGHHARFERRGNQSFILDLNSSNGTFVNGQRVQQAQLFGKETILLGDTHLRFEALL